MLEVTTLQAEREKRETIEFIEILKTMSASEKQQLKGIMIGIKLSKVAYLHDVQEKNFSKESKVDNAEIKKYQQISLF